MLREDLLRDDNPKYIPRLVRELTPGGGSPDGSPIFFSKESCDSMQLARGVSLAHSQLVFDPVSFVIKHGSCTNTELAALQAGSVGNNFASRLCLFLALVWCIFMPYFYFKFAVKDCVPYNDTDKCLPPRVKRLSLSFGPASLLIGWLLCRRSDYVVHKSAKLRRLETRSFCISCGKHYFSCAIQVWRIAIFLPYFYWVRVRLPDAQYNSFKYLWRALGEEDVRLLITFNYCTLMIVLVATSQSWFELLLSYPLGELYLRVLNYLLAPPASLLELVKGELLMMEPKYFWQRLFLHSSTSFALSAEEFVALHSIFEKDEDFKASATRHIQWVYVIGRPELGKWASLSDDASLWEFPLKQMREERFQSQLSSKLAALKKHSRDISPASLSHARHATPTDRHATPISRHATPTSRRSANPLEEEVERTFKVFSVGQTRLDGRSFVKLLQDCGLIDSSQVFQKGACDTIFMKASRGKKWLDVDSFFQALGLLANDKLMDINEVLQAVAEKSSAKPTYNNPTKEVAAPGPVGGAGIAPQAALAGDLNLSLDLTTSSVSGSTFGGSTTPAAYGSTPGIRTSVSGSTQQTATRQRSGPSNLKAAVSAPVCMEDQIEALIEGRGYISYSGAEKELKFSPTQHGREEPRLPIAQPRSQSRSPSRSLSAEFLRDATPE